MSALWALALYQWRILPPTRTELERWEARAARMPEGPRRGAALSALREKRGNPEATAVFAILAPRPRRAAALRAIVALQVAIDYLDSLGEQLGADPLAEGLALHEALVDAVAADRQGRDSFRPRTEADDGGYLAELVASCRSELVGFPAREALTTALERAVRRCGAGQSHTHAAARGEPEALRRWAESLEDRTGSYLWWELAAGASSSVAAHALIAAAADPESTAELGESIDAAYYPSIGALTVLLDDLIDRDADLAAGEHNYLSYAGDEEAAERIGLLADRAKSAIAGLPQAGRHDAILAGVAAFYLATPAARSGYARPIAERLLESLRPTVRPIMAAMRVRRLG